MKSKPKSPKAGKARVKDLKPKRVKPSRAAKVSGGRAGGGTQSEDEVYVG